MKPRKFLQFDHLEDRLVMSGYTIQHPKEKIFPTYSIDGTGNNPAHPDWGSAGSPLLRNTTIGYSDGISAPAGTDRPSPRVISNLVNSQEDPIPNSRHLSNFAFIWGQFLDHDIDLTIEAEPEEPLPISVPAGDPFFDPHGTGTQTISFHRSEYDPSTGTSIHNPRRQINAITAWIDGSMVYGSSQAVADSLRTFSGGKLKTSAGNLLPLDNSGFFQAGDIRVNENVALTAIHTLFLREHNRIADQLACKKPWLSDEKLYQKARSLVIAEIQSITYNEFLPAILGKNALRPYRGFNHSVNPGVSTIFSTAAFRFAHSILPPELLRLGPNGQTAPEGNLRLRDAFIKPQEIIKYGIDSLLRGGAGETAQHVDTKIVDGVRNFLFGLPGQGGFDLASLNIQRGRDHGLPSYNQARIDFGLPPVKSFAQISSDPKVQAALQQAYGSVDKIDVWVGGLAENHVRGSSIGPLFQSILVDQFTRLRDGDPKWFQRIYKGDQLRQLEKTTLRDIIERNTGVTHLQRNVFFNLPGPCNHHQNGCFHKSEPFLREDQKVAPQQSAPLVLDMNNVHIEGHRRQDPIVTTEPTPRRSNLIDFFPVSQVSRPTNPQPTSPPAWTQGEAFPPNLMDQLALNLAAKSTQW